MTVSSVKDWSMVLMGENKLLDPDFVGSVPGLAPEIYVIIRKEN